VNEIIAPALNGYDVADQTGYRSADDTADGTANKVNLRQRNAAVSMAAAKAAAEEASYHYTAISVVRMQKHCPSR